MKAEAIYRAYVTAILTVATVLAGATIAGVFDRPVGGPAAPQQGFVIQSYDADRATFNNEVLLDTTQVQPHP